MKSAIDAALNYFCQRSPVGCAREGRGGACNVANILRSCSLERSAGSYAERSVLERFFPLEHITGNRFRHATK